MTDEVVYWLWLYSVLGPCNGKFAGMLEDYGSASDIYGMKNSGDFLRRLSPKEIAGLGGAKLEGAEKMAERCGKAGVEIVCFGGARYPARLAKTRVPPMLLFVTGDTAALEPVFSVAGVGARSGTEYGRRAVRKICVPLARAGVTLVSGLACGIDGEVHRAALECGGQTIAVMGNPIDSTYPAVHRELRREIERAGGVVVSEYPPVT
jgi:DNA processing protein